MKHRFTTIGLFIIITTGLSGQKMTREQYVSKYYQMAVDEMNLHKIPASITLAQGILETENGNSDLARIANNHFGIKCKRTWRGMKFVKDDDAKDECFRAYATANESFRDHSLFLKGDRYADLFRYDTKDYKSWAYGLKAAGYATNPKYPILLIKHIEELELYQFDNYGSVAKSAKQDTIRLTVDNPIEEGIDTHRTNLIAKFTRNERANNLKCIIVGKDFDINKVMDTYKISQANLFRYNDIDGPSQLNLGQNLFLEQKLDYSPLGIHEVKRGETLYDISQIYGVKLEKIKWYNNINGWEQPVVGQIVLLNKKRETPLTTRHYQDVMEEKATMEREKQAQLQSLELEKTKAIILDTATVASKIPNTEQYLVMHKVKKEENLFRIAKLYDVPPAQILVWNDLSLEQGLKLGQSLKIITSKAPIVEKNKLVIPKSRLPIEESPKTSISTTSLKKEPTKKSDSKINISTQPEVEIIYPKTSEFYTPPADKQPAMKIKTSPANKKEPVPSHIKPKAAPHKPSSEISYETINALYQKAQSYKDSVQRKSSPIKVVE